MPITRRALIAIGTGMLCAGCSPAPDETTTSTPTRSISSPLPTLASADPAAIASAVALVRADLPKQGKPVATLKIRDDSPLNGGLIHLWDVRTTATSCVLTWAITYPSGASSTTVALDERFIPTIRVGKTVIRASQSLPDTQTWKNIATPQAAKATKALAGFALYAPLDDAVTAVTIGADASKDTARLKVKRGGASHPSGTSAIPILGRTLTLDRAHPGNKSPMIITVHGVRRLPRATALYFSLAFPEGTKTIDPAQWGGSDTIFRQSAAASTNMLSNTHLVDHANLQGYSTILDNGQPLGSDLSLLQSKVITKRSAGVAWSLLPSLPVGTKEVDVIIGGSYFLSVPVEDGPMTPVSTEDYIALGAGWPTIIADDPAEVNRLGHGEYTATIRDNATTRTITATGGSNLDLDANVLFKGKSATLTGKAPAVFTVAAKSIRASGKSGQLTITGHTDSKGSASDNLALSEARAAAVAEALRKYLPSTYGYRIVGSGEQQPIATQRTAAGRARNNRISISSQG